MTNNARRAFPLKPLLIALGLDAATLGCFAAFYGSLPGKTLWLVGGLLCAIASFPFYVKVVAGSPKKTGA